MTCFKCEIRLHPLLICDPPIDVGLIDNGGMIRFEFGYGSRHDNETASGYVCDDCFTAFRAAQADPQPAEDQR